MESKWIFIYFLVSLLHFAMSIGPLSGDYRFESPEIISCLRRIRCFNTREWMPVCASDGKIYANKGKMRCLNLCLRPYDRLTVAHSSRCS